MPAVYGENAVIRILDREMITESIGELRLTNWDSPITYRQPELYIRLPMGCSW